MTKEKQAKLCTCNYGVEICKFSKTGFHPNWLICGHIGETPEDNW